MIDIRKSLPAKVAALFLTVILAGLCALSSIGIYFCWNSGYYESDQMTFLDTNDFRQLSLSLADQALYCYVWDQSPDSFNSLSDGVGFTIASAENPDSILYSTVLPTSPIWTDTISVHSGPYSDYGSSASISEEALTKLDQEYLVTLYLDHIPTTGGYLLLQQLFDLLYPMRFILCFIAPLCLLLSLILLVFLCCAAGHRNGTEEITFNWQDRIPLDLYLAADLFAAVFCILMTDQFGYYGRFFMLALSITLLTVLGLALLMTLSTRLKVGGWWRNTLIYRAGKTFIRLVSRMARAIRETDRRREIQRKFNEEHGIVPQTVKKAVRDVVEMTRPIDKAAGSGEVSKLSKKELKDWIGRLEKEMRQAAKELDFERAAELRDLMLEMRAQLV